MGFMQYSFPQMNLTIMKTVNLLLGLAVLLLI